jgi:N-acetyl-gamma-glutamyl-phosphate reductase
MSKIRVGILGSAGYTGGELLRLLVFHPQVNIVFAHSKSKTGQFISDVHTDLIGETDLKFVDEISNEIDVLFLCLSHGETSQHLHLFREGIKVIDLSQDFRINSPKDMPFIYGLPELNKKKIAGADYIANPGCFATSIQLALLPIANANLLQSPIFIACTTGSTGAGQSLSNTSHFSWRQNNLSVYKAFTHQHLLEINDNLKKLQSDFKQHINILPQRGAFTRGILSCITLESKMELKALQELYSEYYKDHPFTIISHKPIDLKQVVNTNKCLLYLEKHEDQIMIVSIIDNLLKGASGQAVQNMNLMFGLEETIGLKLKATAF